MEQRYSLTTCTSMTWRRLMTSWISQLPRNPGARPWDSASPAAPRRSVPLLTVYLDHMRTVRGLEPKTCEGLLVVARRVVAWYDDHAPDQPLAAMTGEHTLALVQHLLSLSTNDYTRSSTTSYIRFRLSAEAGP